jgi:hypothetical protein
MGGEGFFSFCPAASRPILLLPRGQTSRCLMVESRASGGITAARPWIRLVGQPLVVANR